MLGGAGKTTLTERLLYAAGVISEPGSVDAGTTQTDSLALERQLRAALGQLAEQDRGHAGRRQRLLPGLTSGEGVAEPSFAGYRPLRAESDRGRNSPVRHAPGR